MSSLIFAHFTLSVCLHSVNNYIISVNEVWTYEYERYLCSNLAGPVEPRH